jgi:hypothetical protein
MLQMDATFELIDPSGKVWKEIDLPVEPAPFNDFVAGLTRLYGVLVVKADDGATTTITDDFDAMMQELCLRSVVALSEGKDVDYVLAAHAEKVTFRSKGSAVQIAGNVSNEMVCDRAALVVALLDYGARYVDFKTAQLGPSSAAYFRNELDRAMAAVVPNDP